MSATCSRCRCACESVEEFNMRWADDVSGVFLMCEACVVLYQQYIVEPDEETECDPEDEEIVLEDEDPSE